MSASPDLAGVATDDLAVMVEHLVASLCMSIECANDATATLTSTPPTVLALSRRLSVVLDELIDRAGLELVADIEQHLKEN